MLDLFLNPVFDGDFVTSGCDHLAISVVAPRFLRNLESGRCGEEYVSAKNRSSVLGKVTL